MNSSISSRARFSFGWPFRVALAVQPEQQRRVADHRPGQLAGSRRGRAGGASRSAGASARGLRTFCSEVAQCPCQVRVSRSANGCPRRHHPVQPPQRQRRGRSCSSRRVPLAGRRVRPSAAARRAEVGRRDGRTPGPRRAPARPTRSPRSRAGPPASTAAPAVAEARAPQQVRDLSPFLAMPDTLPRPCSRARRLAVLTGILDRPISSDRWARRGRIGHEEAAHDQFRCDAIDRLRGAVAGPVLAAGDPGWPAEVPPSTCRDPRSRGRGRRHLAQRRRGGGALGGARGCRSWCRPPGTGRWRRPRVVLVTTGRMREVSVDPGGGSRPAAAGALWSEVVAVTAEHGLAPLSGSSSQSAWSATRWRRRRPARPGVRLRRRPGHPPGAGDGGRIGSARSTRSPTPSCSGRCAAARATSASSPSSSSAWSRSPRSPAARSSSTVECRRAPAHLPHLDGDPAGADHHVDRR